MEDPNTAGGIDRQQLLRRQHPPLPGRGTAQGLEEVWQVDDRLMLVVSDTSDRTPLGQKPSPARGFVSVSDSTITSFA
jgi:hypothetical protein